MKNQQALFFYLFCYRRLTPREYTGITNYLLYIKTINIFKWIQDQLLKLFIIYCVPMFLVPMMSHEVFNTNSSDYFQAERLPVGISDRQQVAIDFRESVQQHARL